MNDSDTDEETTLVKPVSDARAIAVQEGAPHHEEAAETETPETGNSTLSLEGRALSIYFDFED